MFSVSEFGEHKSSSVERQRFIAHRFINLLDSCGWFAANADMYLLSLAVVHSDGTGFLGIHDSADVLPIVVDTTL